MATNVTQKDKTLNEIIAWAKQSRKVALHSASRNKLEHANTRALWNEGRMSAFDDVIKHCKSQLGYTGSMPSEVPNQSEE